MRAKKIRAIAATQGRDPALWSVATAIMAVIVHLASGYGSLPLP